MNFYNCHISSTGIRPIVYSVQMAYITFLLEAEHLHETKSWQKFQHIARPPQLQFMSLHKQIAMGFN